MEQHMGNWFLAILQGEDYEDTVYELNQNGFFCYDAQLHRRISKKAQHHHHDRR